MEEFDPLAGLFDGLNTKSQSAGGRSRPDVGVGVYVLEKYGPKQTEKGVIMEAKLRIAKVAEGSQNKVGDQVELAWFIYKGPKEGGENEKARARDFVNALLGRPQMTPAGPESRKLSAREQPGSGIAVQIEGKDISYKKKDGSKGEGRNYAYSHLPQSGEQIASQRKWLASLTPVTEPVTSAATTTQPTSGLPW